MLLDKGYISIIKLKLLIDPLHDKGKRKKEIYSAYYFPIDNMILLIRRLKKNYIKSMIIFSLVHKNISSPNKIPLIFFFTFELILFLVNTFAFKLFELNFL